jgi:septum formation protein|tara:strand:+ start:22 stop:624 length:603 start_codon:yes stop_codon:yes gene_type:complete
MSESTADLILASASPRRSELLCQIAVRFTILATDIDETRLLTESPEDYVARLALEKARAGYSRQEGQLPSLGADTIVVCDRQIFGKPRNQADAAAMLMALSGRDHTVITAVAISQGPCSSSRLSKTLVRFRTITQSECQAYWQTGEPQGKAGGYAIQGRGAIFVDHLEGSYSGVVGLPLSETAEILGEFGIPMWTSVPVL